MTLSTLTNISLGSEDSFYWDTSVVYSLALSRHPKQTATSQRELRRISALSAFINASTSSGTRNLTSILVLEEIAALVRNRIRTVEADRAGFRSWSEFKQSAAEQAMLRDKTAHQGMLEILQCAIDGIRTAKIELEWPDQSETPPQKLRKFHREILRTVPTIDAMDALHIVVGLSLGIKKFISFDTGWRDCPLIEVVTD